MPLKYNPAHAGLNYTKINILPKNARILELRYYIFPAGKKPFGEFEQHVVKSFRLSA